MIKHAILYTDSQTYAYGLDENIPEPLYVITKETEDYVDVPSINNVKSLVQRMR